MDARCRIEMFGELRVIQGDRVTTRFRTHKAASMLAYLALHLQQSHSRDRLIDLFWPDMDLDAGRDNLSTALSSLRRQLEPTGIPAGSILIADRQNVRLNPAAVSTDVAEFEELLLAASQAADPAGRAALLERAVGLYRGELLPGCYDEWVTGEQTRLAERYVDVLQQWSAVLEESGDLEAALEAATRAFQADPYREESCRTLMRLYAALDRAAAALDAYQELERFLKEELGVSPAAATRELAGQLRRDPHAFARTKEQRPQRVGAGGYGSRRVKDAHTPTHAHSHTSAPNLPLQLTRFFGREEEIARLQELVSGERADDHSPRTAHHSRLITLTGPGGSGKTRLAIEVAQRLALALDGRVWFVALADLPDPALIPYALANALKLSPAPGADPLERVVEALGEQPCLLVLDNFEHLLRETNAKGDNPGVGGSVALVRMLLERAPGLVCLVTSRMALHLGGELTFPVPPLTTPTLEPQRRRDTEQVVGQPGDTITQSPNHLITPEHLMQYPSVQLYVDRAQLAKPDFALTTNNAKAVATLCRRLEGMPLAIEMAAAWAKTLPPAKMLERLEHQLNLLVSRRRDLPPRHQSLRATIEWSYDLLEPALRMFFAWLAVFRGGWTLEAAEAVCGSVEVGEYGRQAPAHPYSDTSTLDFLAQLQEHSLIVVEEGAEETRYRLLEPLREFAEEKLAEAGEMETVRRAHAAYYLSLAEKARTCFYTPDAKARLDQMEAEHDNFRAALDWCMDFRLPEDGNQIENVQMGLRLAAALQRFWNARAYLREGQARYTALLKHPGAAARTKARAEALNGAGTLAYLQADYAAARAFHEEELAIFRELGERHGEASALHGLGNIAYSEQDYAAARAYYAESLAIRTALGDQSGIAASCHSLGNVETREGNYEAARERFGTALKMRQDIGDRLASAYTMGALGQLAQAEKDYPAARHYCREALLIFREMGVRWTLTLCLNDLSRIAEAQGDLERAVRLYSALSVLRETVHHPLPPAERQEHRERLEAIRRTLGNAAFEAAWAAGRAMTVDEAVEYALDKT